ncbi:MAG: DUF2332 domain-containing protein [Ilumatobacteraceae bacterium]|nr:DUF2332 domain-containing protein [Ilumatobacteraceae bacterium]
MAAPELSFHDALLHQSGICAQLGSPLYEAIFRAMAVDLNNNGETARISEHLTIRPMRDAAPLRIAGVIHRLALTGKAPSVARHFPSTGGTPGPTLIADYLEALATFRNDIDEGLSRTVQTNEVGRTTMLVTGMSFFAREVGIPATHLREVGSSCGLNLQVDEYFFEANGTSYGNGNALVRFEDSAWGTPRPDIAQCPALLSRAGCDIAPLDAHNINDQFTLLSFVWPDQFDRFARLRNAINNACASSTYVSPDQQDAAEWIHQQFENISFDEPVLIFHSIVWQYLSQETKKAFREAVNNHCTQRSAPTGWLRMEPAGPVADLRIDIWHGTKKTHGDQVIADSSFHGIGTRSIVSSAEVK